MGVLDCNWQAWQAERSCPQPPTAMAFAEALWLAMADLDLASSNPRSERKPRQRPPPGASAIDASARMRAKQRQARQHPRPAGSSQLGPSWPVDRPQTPDWSTRLACATLSGAPARASTSNTTLYKVRRSRHSAAPPSGERLWRCGLLAAGGAGRLAHLALRRARPSGSCKTAGATCDSARWGRDHTHMWDGCADIGHVPVKRRSTVRVGGR